MLSFERVIFEDIKDECRFQDLDFFIEANKTQINRFAHENEIDVETVIKQIKLHAPQFEKRLYTTRSFLKKNIFPILLLTIEKYKKNFEEYLELCGGDIFDKGDQLAWDKDRNKKSGIKTFFIVKGKSEVKGEIKIVEETVGNFIEENLHYLRAPRNDSIIRFGLFLDNYKFPICYMNFSAVDRDDKWKALYKSLDEDIKKREVVELSRVFGCGNLPQNSISLLISYAVRYFRKINYSYMITAVNITLGFSGNSMLASRFVPYAIRPINYYYNDNNQYCTKRKGKYTHFCKNKMPPNILFVREVGQSKGKIVKYCRLIDISNNYSYNETAIEHEIYAIRQELEGVWNEKTRYHGTIVDENSYISKGQCGVSSLLLARILEKRGYEVKFCEGDAIFPKDNQSIINHCWIKVINYNKRKENVIIDITADQNGYWQKILFKTEADLKKLKIHYSVKSEKSPETVNVEHLIERLVYLEKELIDGGINYE